MNGTVIIEEQKLLKDFVVDFPESADEEVVCGDAKHQPVYKLSLNGIRPNENECILLPSKHEALKLQELLKKLSV